MAVKRSITSPGSVQPYVSHSCKRAVRPICYFAVGDSSTILSARHRDRQRGILPANLSAVPTYIIRNKVCQLFHQDCHNFSRLLLPTLYSSLPYLSMSPSRRSTKKKSSTSVSVQSTKKQQEPENSASGCSHTLTESMHARTELK